MLRLLRMGSVGGSVVLIASMHWLQWMLQLVDLLRLLCRGGEVRLPPFHL